MERQRKRELRALNHRAWAGESDVFPVRSSQDSSLKKNTAFIKRLRTSITKETVSTFLQEVGSLSLHRYLSEIISACYEGLCRLKTPADIAAGVEIVSALHERFGPTEFTGFLGWLIGRGLSTPDKSQLKSLAQDVREREEKERLSRQRVLLRVATELWLVGVLRSLEDVMRPDFEAKAKDNGKIAEPTAKSKTATNGLKLGAADSEPFPLEVLKDLLGHDREHVNLPLVVLFVKSFAWDILGIKSQASDGRKTATEEGTTEGRGKADDSAHSDADDTSDDPPFTSPELRQRYKNVFLRYFEDVKAHVVRDQETLVAQGRRNAEAYVRSGEVFEDRQSNFEKQIKAQEKLIANTQVLADVLEEEMPDLKDKDEAAAGLDGGIGLVKAGDYLRGQGDGPGIWEDEDERRFYENIVDIKDRVPGILLDDGKKKKTDKEDPVGKRAEAKPTAEETTASSETKLMDLDDESTAIANKSVGAQVDALLARLPDLLTKDMVDEFAVDFCFVNSKASRNRLIKAIVDVPKGRTDLLPQYSRIIATLSKYMPDVSQAVISHLDEEFRSLQRRKSKEFLGAVRLLNIRYLAELTKFGVVPEHVIFHCLKVCLDELSRMNIEIMANLMENCGRYLLRNPETSPRMTSFLETLQRKKGAQHLEQRERLILDNAIYHVNPPERPAIEQKERTPMELFIRKIVYDDLTKRNVDKVSKQIRKFHWEEPEVVTILEKIFTKPWKIRYNNVHLLAVMVGAVYRYHTQFAITVIDELLESITQGLELNEVKFNQRRIAEVKYLGELYVYRMVDSPLIFDTMYKILTFGHEGGMPRPNSENPFDAPNDWFRIRLICILLETCSGYFDKGSAKKKLDFFITFFQYYINTKDPWSPDIDFAIQDAFAVVGPDLKLINGLDEAAKSFSEAVKINYQANAVEKASEMEDVEDESESDEGPDEDDDQIARDEGKSSGEDNEEPVQDEDTVSESEDEEEHIVVTRKEDQRDPELDAEFDRELAKMMADSIDARKLERKALFDVPLPMRRSQHATTADDNAHNETEASPNSPGMTREIDLPADSTFAIAMRRQQQAEKEEQQRIKNLVLNLDLRDETEAVDGEDPLSYVLEPNPNIRQNIGNSRASFKKKRPGMPNLARKDSENSHAYSNISNQGALDKHPQNPYMQPRLDKAGKGRSTQRARQLQVSDLDWYSNTSQKSSATAEAAPRRRRGHSHKSAADGRGARVLG